MSHSQHRNLFEIKFKKKQQQQMFQNPKRTNVLFLAKIYVYLHIRFIYVINQ